MKLAGVARFDCVGSTQEFTCYIAGFVSPGDHTCGWTTSTLHSRLAWRYWFRWGCGASSTSSLHVGFVADTVHMLASNRPKPGSATPFPSLCTRSEVVQCLRIGCITSSLTSVVAELAVRDDPTGAQQAQAVEHCTRYDSNALGRKALH